MSRARRLRERLKSRILSGSQPMGRNCHRAPDPLGSARFLGDSRGFALGGRVQTLGNFIPAKQNQRLARLPAEAVGPIVRRDLKPANCGGCSAVEHLAPPRYMAPEHGGRGDCEHAANCGPCNGSARNDCDARAA